MDRERTLRPDFSAARGRRLLIALSGGADSVALAVMLAEAREAYDLTLFAAHVDHGIRAESAEDASFCRDLCEKLDIPFHCARLDLAAESQRLHVGLETLARQRRYAYLRATLNDLGCDFITLAHHMDDQAETVLMHLARGAGAEGVSGMREMCGPLYRPLLKYRKAELADYLRERGFGWQEDATNRVADNPRNALRLNVIPEIERWYPQFVRAVSRFSLTSQAEGDLMAQLTDDYLSKHSFAGPMCAWVEVEPPPHRAIMRRAIRAMCPGALDFDQVAAVETLCHRSKGRIDLSETTFAERTGSRLYFVPKRPPVIQPAPLTLDGVTGFEPLGTLTASPWSGGPVRDDPMRQALNPDVLAGALLRTRRPGDRIRPLGGGDKLLSDYFIDKKVDRPLRDATPLVAVGNRVHWVVGHGISQEAALRPGDKAVILKYEYKSE